MASTAHLLPPEPLAQHVCLQRSLRDSGCTAPAAKAAPGSTGIKGRTSPETVNGMLHTECIRWDGRVSGVSMGTRVIPPKPTTFFAYRQTVREYQGLVVNISAMSGDSMTRTAGVGDRPSHAHPRRWQWANDMAHLGGEVLSPSQHKWSGCHSR